MPKFIQKCLLCGGMISMFQERLYDTRFGVYGLFDVYKCKVCGLVQLNLSLNKSQLSNLYENYYNFCGSKDELYTKLRRTFLESILYRFWIALDGDICFHSRKGNSRLLDIGCNEGRGLNIYKKNGFSVEGLEINKRAASVARKRGFRVYTVSLASFRPEELYDVVVLSHVLEHSTNPKEMLLHISRILKPHGEIWISTPNIKSWQKDIFGRYWINWHIPFHITFFSSATLKHLLKDVGFKVKKIKYFSPSLWVSQSIISLLFAESGKTNFTQRSPILLGTIMIFIRFLVFPMLWFGNLLGCGDCIVVDACKETDATFKENLQ